MRRTNTFPDCQGVSGVGGRVLDSPPLPILVVRYEYGTPLLLPNFFRMGCSSLQILQLRASFPASLSVLVVAATSAAIFS